MESSGPAAHKKTKDKFVETSCSIFIKGPTKDAKVTSIGYTALNNPYPAEAKHSSSRELPKPLAQRVERKPPVRIG